ncbi:hypothetical protein GL263_26765, partial [Streptomyces durbertensis]|nr:hypothetical protein [Streptomyces durbertensis]
PEDTPSKGADPDGDTPENPDEEPTPGDKEADGTAPGGDDGKPGASRPQGAATPATASPTASDPATSPTAPDPAASSADPALAPRPLPGIGDAAYLNDRLVTADAGLHRDITVVFRAGNVLVTVEYNEWSNDKRRIPGSEELQEKAQKLAKQLAARLDS